MIVQFKVLSGSMAGVVWATRHFPVRLGRASDVEFRLVEPGVWDRHCELDFDPVAGFALRRMSEGLVLVNGEPVESALLRNGDVIDCGSVKLRFWLGEAQQGGLRLREAAVWTLLGLIPLAQLALMYWLAR